MYQGNSLLRSSSEKITYTKKQLREWVRCKEDIFYFAEHYFTVVEIDTGKHLIKLREYQKRMLKGMLTPPVVPEHKVPIKQHAICLSSRQVGKCCSHNTRVKIRNKKTGKIEEVSMGNFYENMKNN